MIYAIIQTRLEILKTNKMENDMRGMKSDYP